MIISQFGVLLDPLPAPMTEPRLRQALPGALAAGPWSHSRVLVVSPITLKLTRVKAKGLKVTASG